MVIRNGLGRLAPHPSPETAPPRPETALPRPETALPRPETAPPRPETALPRPETAPPSEGVELNCGEMDARFSQIHKGFVIFVEKLVGIVVIGGVGGIALGSEFSSL